MQVALQQVLPDRVMASSYATGNNLTAWGYDPASREEFLWYIFESGGCGARATKDGHSAEWHLMANCKNESMEVWEQRYPVRLRCYQLVENSAGPGRWRGGLGVTRQLEMLLPTTQTANADRHIVPPPGFFRGSNGTLNRFGMIRDGRDRTFQEVFGTPSPSKFSNLQAQQGDMLAVTQGGGAGYGDPLEREPALVAADVKQGYVSTERARSDYAVVLDQNGGLDLPATQELRAQLRGRAAA